MAQGRESRRSHLRLVAPLQEQEVLPQVQEAPQQGLEALLRELEAQVEAQVQQLALAQAEVILLEQAVESVLELVAEQEELQPQVQEEE